MCHQFISVKSFIAEHNRAEHNRTEQNRTEQSRIEHNRAEQNRAEQTRTTWRPEWSEAEETHGAVWNRATQWQNMKRTETKSWTDSKYRAEGNSFGKHNRGEQNSVELN